MPVANLLQKLKTAGKDGLRDLMLYGRVRCMLKGCSLVGNISTSCDGAYAIVDVFAIQCLGADYFAEIGTNNRDQIYSTKGSVVIYLNNASLVGKYVKVSGRSANKGVTVKQNIKHKKPNDGIVAFVWSKGRTGNDWMINPNVVSELAKDDPNIVSSPFLEYVIKDIGLNSAIEDYPESNVMEYEGVSDYEELTLDEMNNIKYGVHHSEGKVDLTKIDLHLTRHDKGVGPPQYFYDVKDDIEEQARRRTAYAKELMSDIKK